MPGGTFAEHHGFRILLADAIGKDERAVHTKFSQAIW